MQAVEEAFAKACEDGTVPGAVLLAETRDGSFKYAKAIGAKNLETKEAMSLDTTMAIASCTKLLTTICTLQLCQAGKLKPDTDVLPHLPELAKQPILTGFDKEGKPKLHERKAGITVHHLLTHSFGGAYQFLSPSLMKYNSQSQPTSLTVAAMASIPLLLEPDQGWSYSHGLDWAGLLLERLTGTDLDSYMREHIWKPLGLSDDEIGFWPKDHPQLLAKKAALAIRANPSESVRFLGHDPVNGASVEAFGGHGLIASMPAYMKILRSLADPEDERLLNRDWKAEMFKPQLGKRSEDHLNDILNDPVMSAAFVGELPADRVRYSFSYGGLLSLNGDKDWRSKSTLLWSGFMNLLWYIDPEAGLCVLFGCQVATPGDKRIESLISMFEKAVYAQLRTQSRL